MPEHRVHIKVLVVTRRAVGGAEHAVPRAPARRLVPHRPGAAGARREARQAPRLAEARYRTDDSDISRLYIPVKEHRTVSQTGGFGATWDRRWLIV